jgi:hypothetical protein
LPADLEKLNADWIKQKKKASSRTARMLLILSGECDCIAKHGEIRHMLNLGRITTSCCKWLAAVIMLAMPSSAFAVPQQLYGKSIIVSWREDRQQKFPDEKQMRSVGAFAEFNVYISELGRAFSRVRFSVANKRGKLKSGSKDEVSGENSHRNIGFHGTTMTASMPRGSGGAVQVLVNFESNFQSCSARVIAGKSDGAEAMKIRSLISGARVDMYSVKADGESCRIQSGNVFGN